MFCHECGSRLPDGAKFCPECGTAVRAGTQESEPVTPPPFSSASDAPDPGTAIEPVSAQGPLPMRWYKFVIWVQLFLSALSLAGSGALLLTGAGYSSADMSYAALVYATFDGLRQVDVVFGVALIAVAAFAVYVRQRLAGFKKGAPKLYLTLLGTNIAVQFLYAFAVSIVVRVEMATVITPVELAQALSSLLLIILNKYYFARREHLFVND